MRRPLSPVSRYPKPIRWAVLSASGGPMDTSYLKQPLRLQVARRVVMQNGSIPVDLFHPGVPFEYIDKVFAVMALCPQHTFQIVTRHAEHLRDYFLRYATRHKWGAAASLFSGKRDGYFGTCDNAVCGCTYPLPNVWLGLGLTNQAEADAQLPALFETPAAVRFAYFDPMVEPVSILPALKKAMTCRCNQHSCGWPVCRQHLLHWIVVRGEREGELPKGSGEPWGFASRPLHPVWVRDVLKECQSVGIPFRFEGWGEWLHDSQTGEDLWAWVVSTGQIRGFVNDHRQYGGSTYRVGAERAGRLLDGRVWDELPLELPHELPLVTAETAETTETTETAETAGDKV